MIRELSNYNDHTGDMKPAYHGDPVRCYAYLAPLDKFGIRANTVAAYCDINRKVCLNKQRTVATAVSKHMDTAVEWLVILLHTQEILSFEC
jgi:hypothetical protein